MRTTSRVQRTFSSKGSAEPSNMTREKPLSMHWAQVSTLSL